MRSISRSGTMDRYRTYFDQSSEGIWRFVMEPPVPVDAAEDEQLRLIIERAYCADCNDAMARMHRLVHGSELVGTRLSSMLLDGNSHNRELLRSFVRSGYRLVDSQSHEVDRSGNVRHFLNNVLGVVEGGALVEMWGNLHDITELKRLEGKLRQSTKLEAVGRLAAGVAHDFNNLLSVILSAADLAMGDLPECHSVRADLEIIKDHARRAAGVTRKLLAFSRQQPNHPVEVSLNRMVSEMAPLLRRMLGEGIELHLSLGEDPGCVRADRLQLEQVVLGLVANAREAIGDQGRVAMETGTVVFDADAARLLPGTNAGRYLFLEVTDDGAGMSSDVKARLFEPFLTTKGPGPSTGLGLAVCHGIVSDAGGAIEVVSEVGRGSTFRVYLRQW